MSAAHVSTHQLDHPDVDKDMLKNTSALAHPHRSKIATSETHKAEY